MGSERRIAMSMNTERAHSLIRELWPAVTGEPAPSTLATVAVLAIARGESGYGTGWKNDDLLGNWASAHCPNTGSDCSPEAQKGHKCALASDTLDGTEATRKPQCFKVYDSHREGAADFIKELVIRRRPVRSALNTGDCLTIAHVMRENSYYSKKLPKRHYALMIYLNGREVSARLKIPETVFLRPCRDCSAGSGEPCAKGCPGNYYDGPTNTGPSLAPWATPLPGLPPLGPRTYVPPRGAAVASVPSNFDGGGGLFLVGAAAAFFLGGLL